MCWYFCIFISCLFIYLFFKIQCFILYFLVEYRVESWIVSLNCTFNNRIQFLLVFSREMNYINFIKFCTKPDEMSLKIQLYLKGRCWKIQTIVILQAYHVSISFTILTSASQHHKLSSLFQGHFFKISPSFIHI